MGLPGYYCKPEKNNGSKTGVLVLHDIFGMGIPNTKYVVDHFASQGFESVAPDFFSNRGLEMPCWPADEFEITEPLQGDLFQRWFGSLVTPKYWQRFNEDVDHALAFLKAKGCRNFVCIGFCWGGKAAEHCAASGKFKAAVSCHGVMHDGNSYKDCKCPMLYITVPDDPFFGPAEHTEIMQAGGTVNVYSGMYHGFMVRGDYANNEGVRKAMEGGYAQSIHFIKACTSPEGGGGEGCGKGCSIA